MADGTPVYKNGSYSDGNGVYKGDKTIADVRANRDSRLSVFLKEPGQKNILVDGTSPLSTFYRTEPYPGILHYHRNRNRSYKQAYHLPSGNSARKHELCLKPSYPDWEKYSC